jgi:predicted enzyme related to lactoylglutathione lyase
MNALLFGITIPSDDLVRAVEFYRDVIGFEVKATTETSSFLQTGRIPMAIYQAGADAEMDAAGPGIVLNIQVDDIDVAEQRVRGAGVDVLRRWDENGTRNLLVTDPDGNRVEFFEARKRTTH